MPVKKTTSIKTVSKTSTKTDPIKGKQLTKQPVAKMTKPEDIKVSEKTMNSLTAKASKSLETRQKAAAKKKRNEGMAKLAAGAAGTATAMYYGLTKTVGGNEHRDAQGNVTGKSKKRRVPIWSKDQGY
jgi:hypothetical protein